MPSVSCEEIRANENSRDAKLIWQPDADTDICMLCCVIFSLTRRKHHCRMCGKIFCSDCSNHRIPITSLNNMRARVCLLCYKKSNLNNSTKRDSSETVCSIHPVSTFQKIPSIIVSLPNGDKTLKWDLKEREVMNILKDDKLLAPVTFAVNPNLVVMVKIIKISKFPGQSYWLFVSRGLKVVGQDEVVVVLERDSGYHQHHLSTSEPSSCGGSCFLYLDVMNLKRNSYQDGHHYHHHPLHPFHEIWDKFPFVPKTNFLLSILLSGDEQQAARRIPLRLMTGLALNQGLHPYPLISKRQRRSFCSLNTRSIIDDYLKHLEVSDLIDGMKIMIHEFSNITLTIPRASYNKLMKCMNSASEMLVLLGDFDENSCRCLTCGSEDGKSMVTFVASCDGADYNFNKGSKGASFLIIQSSSVPSKCSFEIIEDGVVLDLGRQGFNEFKSSLRVMRDCHFGVIQTANECKDDFDMAEEAGNSTNIRQSFTLTWTDEEDRLNIGVISEIDGRLLEGIKSLRLPIRAKEAGIRFLEREDPSIFFQVQPGVPIVRWLEVFFIDLRIPDVLEDSFNVMNFIERIGHACCRTLQRHASLLDENLSRFGVRITMKNGDKVMAEIGSNMKPLPSPCPEDVEETLMQNLTEPFVGLQLAPISIVFELLFQVVSLKSTMRNCPDLNASQWFLSSMLS